MAAPGRGRPPCALPAPDEGTATSDITGSYGRVLERREGVVGIEGRGTRSYGRVLRSCGRWEDVVGIEGGGRGPVTVSCGPVGGGKTW